jgi:hypothetical protein
MLRGGAVAEWLMAAVLKTAGAQALVSSNLTRSATRQALEGRCGVPREDRDTTLEGTVSDQPMGSRSAPRRRQLANGLGYVALVALVIAIPAILISAPWSCGCTAPVDLIVLNYAHDDATVSWQGTGLLGTPVLGVSGSASAPACATLTQTLRPGEVDVSIRAGADARTSRVTVSERQAQDGRVATFVIGADGRIAEPTDGPPAGGYPQDPLCG